MMNTLFNMYCILATYVPTAVAIDKFTKKETKRLPETAERAAWTLIHQKHAGVHTAHQLPVCRHGYLAGPTVFT